MNIALFGYGKMGRMIADIALKRGHQIVAKIDLDTTEIDFSAMDVAIDFSVPQAAFGNIANCFKHNVPVISGTTGWLDRYNEAVQLCHEHQGAFIYASNFSLGVNLFFELNDHLAKMMANLGQYKVGLEEIHHTQKLDAPSGTAITLAEGILQHSRLQGWELGTDNPELLPITSKRIGDTPGTHIVRYESKVDSLEIKHTAHNREGFALGAVIAAEWIADKKGVFSMRNVLNLG